MCSRSLCLLFFACLKTLLWDRSSGWLWRASGVCLVVYEGLTRESQINTTFHPVKSEVNSEVRKEAQAVPQKVQLCHMTSLSSVPFCLNTFHLKSVFLPHPVSFACWLSCLIMKYFISCRFISLCTPPPSDHPHLLPITATLSSYYPLLVSLILCRLPLFFLISSLLSHHQFLLFLSLHFCLLCLFCRLPLTASFHRQHFAFELYLVCCVCLCFIYINDSDYVQ